MAGCFLIIGYMSFLAGTRRYTYKEPGGDAVVGFVHYLWQGARTSWKGALALSGWIMVVVFILLSIAHAFIKNHDTRQTVSYVCLGFAGMFLSRWSFFLSVFHKVAALNMIVVLA